MKSVMPDTNKKTSRSSHLQDSKEDQDKLKGEVTTIDLPEVKDIPGQENIRVPEMREMQDVTASSADEEAEELLKDVNAGENDIDDADNDSNVTEEEISLLRRGAGHPRTEENQDIKNISLDNTDDDGDELNEKALNEDRFGEDLDVPGAELDDEDEEVGEEDEENNQYSNRD